MHRRLFLAAGAGALATAAQPGTVRAQQQGFAPAAKPITLVSGYSPGGSTDIAARLLADRFAAHLDPAARVVVDFSACPA